MLMGSPPRVREKPSSVDNSFSRLGITPACAGKTSSDTRDHGATQDHPRVCGKNPLRLHLVQAS